MPRPIPTNPLTATDHQTTLEEDLERARAYKPWLGVRWIIEVGDLAYVCKKTFRSTLIDVSCENADKTQVPENHDTAVIRGSGETDKKTRT